MFEILKVDCTIDDFHVRVTDTKSNTFYEMLAGLWGTKIKNQIEDLVLFLPLLYFLSFSLFTLSS